MTDRLSGIDPFQQCAPIYDSEINSMITAFYQRNPEATKEINNVN